MCIELSMYGYIYIYIYIQIIVHSIMGGGQGHVRRAIANTRTRAKEHDSYVFAQTREHVLAMVCIGYVLAMFWVVTSRYVESVGG